MSLKSGRYNDFRKGAGVPNTADTRRQHVFVGNRDESLQAFAEKYQSTEKAHASFSGTIFWQIGLVFGKALLGAADYSPRREPWGRGDKHW